jgi:acyl-CoA thioesterase FadM
MDLTTVYRIEVLDRDCGPDETVPLHHFTRWLDAASHCHLLACGLAAADAAGALPAVMKARVTEAQITLLEEATPHDTLQFHTRVLHWRHDEVELAHRVLRDDVLICEAHETRSLCPLREPGRSCPGAARRAPRVH